MALLTHMEIQGRQQPHSQTFVGAKNVRMHSNFLLQCAIFISHSRLMDSRLKLENWYPTRGLAPSRDGFTGRSSTTRTSVHFA